MSTPLQESILTLLEIELDLYFLLAPTPWVVRELPRLAMKSFVYVIREGI